VFNANTGHFKIEPKNSLSELDVVYEHANITFHLAANQLTLTSHCTSNRELTELIESVYYVFPFVLSLCLRDPVVIDRVDGHVGSNPFGWELASWQVPILISNQETQEQRVIEAWDLMALLSSLGNMRIVGALRYFRTACRLRTAGHTPWEFMGEMLLNYCKVLEVLFPVRNSQRCTPTRKPSSNIGSKCCNGHWQSCAMIPVFLKHTRCRLPIVRPSLSSHQSRSFLHFLQRNDGAA
jgi:hypothetical protein